jgi:prepilin-type N-terminal cleavage/methylation domain-containing protein
MKSKRGFTLIEVIVVAVIVGILSLIGIQLYTGYITDAKQDTVENLAQTAATAANAYWRKTGSSPSTTAATFVTQTNLYLDLAKYTLTHVGGATKTVTIADINDASITSTANY